MSSFGMWALVLAVLFAVGGGLCLALPRQVRAGLAAFPRGRVAGWLLTTVVLCWCGHLLYHGPLGFLEPYRQWLFGLVPLSIVLVGCFVDELLAARALGGLLILVPAPLLDVARWNPSSGRYLVIALAYAMATSGAALVTVPYVFRKVCEAIVPDDRGCRRVGAWSVLLAVALAVVAARAG